MTGFADDTLAARCQNVRPTEPTAVGLASEAALHGCRGFGLFHPFTVFLLSFLCLFAAIKVFHQSPITNHQSPITFLLAVG
jgi:hypothetical protein